MPDDVCSELAWLAATVYEPLREMGGALEDEGFEAVTTLSMWRIGTQGALAIKGRTAVIAFRGSESILDWLVDLAFVPCGSPRRHAGFHLAWLAVRRQVVAWLDGHRDRFDHVRLCGHSLGGAIAKVAALDLAVAYPVDAVVTLGAPRAFWGSGVACYDTATAAGGAPLGARTKSYVNGADIVARLPPAFFGYRHTEGACPSVTVGGGWLADVLSEIRLRQAASSLPLRVPLPPAPAGPRVAKPAPTPIITTVADWYCWLEQNGPVPKALVVTAVAPFGLCVAYLWTLWILFVAGSSHKLDLYHDEFFPLVRRRVTSAPASALAKVWRFAARLGGRAVKVVVLLGLAWVASHLFRWGAQTAVAMFRR